MKFPSRKGQFQCIDSKLAAYSSNKRLLLGVQDPTARRALALQIVSSLRREDYYKYAYAHDADPQRANPHHRLFNPEKAVGLHVKSGDIDEASWLAFLMTHFGKRTDTGWTRLQDFYGRLGEGIWSWKTTSSNMNNFDRWMEQNWESIGGKFGNHRKFESLNPRSRSSTSAVIRSYVELIGDSGHQAFFDNILKPRPNDLFGRMFGLKILRFGRLGMFDYLMMLSRYNIIDMKPQSAYLAGSSGPVKGVRLLFFGEKKNKVKTKELQCMLDNLDSCLGVGMAVLEDALCNWQKSPQRFLPFRDQ